MFDVFYFGPKPGLFEFERCANSIEHAAELSRTAFYWYIYGGNDYTNFDFDFKPSPWESKYIHVWPNQWQQDGEVYLAKKVNSGQYYFHNQIVKRKPIPEYWDIPEYVDVASIPWDWCPDPEAPPYNYIFGNQWHPSTIDPTASYRVPGAINNQYMEQSVKVLPTKTNWEILDDIVDFDYSWRPNPKDPPYIYVFGNQWLTPEMRPALKYVVPGAIEIKYMPEPRASRQAHPNKFITRHECEFDYSWEPDPGSPPYNYVFGNQWYPANIMPTVEYPMEGATETKFVDYPYAKLLEKRDDRWHTLVECEWDYSWVPDPGDPPYIYVFGNQWHAAEIMPTVEYYIPGATERKFIEFPCARLLSNQTRWTIPEEIVADNIDFSWVPDPGDPPYIYHFGSDYQASIGLTYTVPGATEIKFVGEAPKVEQTRKAVDVLDIFFVDCNNASANKRFIQLQERYPKIQKIRYANSMIETVKRCVTRANTNKFWVISSENVYDDFDFAWHAEPWQGYMTHVFGSQWQKWSDTYLINKWEFERNAKWATGLEQFPNLNFVKDQQVYRPDDVYDIYYIDHFNPGNQEQLDRIKQRYPNIKTARYVDNYLDTFKRIVTTAETEYVWIINSICDYRRFDFTWQPEPWQAEMLHVFPSGEQKFGDTFYVHVPSFKQQMDKLEILDWFEVVNYCDDQRVSRMPVDVVHYAEDSLAGAVKQHHFTGPYAVFTNTGTVPKYTPSIWRKKDRALHTFTNSGAISIVPRDVQADLGKQMYDYPYIMKHKDSFLSEQGLDIIYISNGEKDEQRWYDHTCTATKSDVKWVRGINGRTAAYQAAARASDTPWFLTVFAKLEVNPDFPWMTWQPDYLQEPKHYIFNARNVLNGLEYGHMGVIAYNKKLVLANNNPGLDFTLSQAHESVPLLSATAHYNADPWMTWRTAFREVLKLKYFNQTQPTLETEHRLQVWMSHAEGNNAKWSIIGAQDANDYYDFVNGDYEQLMKSFDWAWLREHFNRLHSIQQ